MDEAPDVQSVRFPVIKFEGVDEHPDVQSVRFLVIMVQQVFISIEFPRLFEHDAYQSEVIVALWFLESNACGDDTPNQTMTRVQKKFKPPKVLQNWSPIHQNHSNSSLPLQEVGSEGQFESSPPTYSRYPPRNLPFTVAIPPLQASMSYSKN